MHKDNGSPNIENVISVLMEMLGVHPESENKKSQNIGQNTIMTPTMAEKTTLDTTLEDKMLSLSITKDKLTTPSITKCKVFPPSASTGDPISLYILAEKQGLGVIALDMFASIIPAIIKDAQGIIRQININPTNRENISSYALIQRKLGVFATLFFPDPTKKLNNTYCHVYIEISETIKDLLEAGKLLPNFMG